LQLAHIGLCTGYYEIGVGKLHGMRIVDLGMRK
jgi:hypothetical protein